MTLQEAEERPIFSSMSEKQRVKVMWDWGAFPVWTVGGGHHGFGVDGGLPLSADLRTELRAWAEDWEAVVMQHQAEGPRGPDRPIPPDVVAEADDRGRLLAQRVQDELGDGFVVGYYSETTHEVEWPDRAP